MNVDITEMTDIKPEELNEVWADKRTAFKRAQVAGYAKHVAQLNGGTGDLRRKLSAEERLQRKDRRKMAKDSRRRNR